MNRPQTVLITGGTSGIGKHTAQAFARNGYQVYITARTKHKGQEARQWIRASEPSASVHVLVGDLSKQQDVRNIAMKFQKQEKTLDILINNAGVIQYTYNVTPDGVEYTFAVNHLAPFLLTNLLIPRLKHSHNARIITVTSTAHRRGSHLMQKDVTKANYSPREAYAQSKLANILFTQTLAEKLNGTRVSSLCYHPGLVRTNIGQRDATLERKFINIIKPLFSISAQTAAKDLVWLATDGTLNESRGEYYVRRRLAQATLPKHHPELARQLWDYSALRTNLLESRL